jgi:hypothetical protein
VNGSIRFLVLALTFVGTLGAGLVAGQIGLRLTLLLGIGCNLLAVLWLLLSPVRRLRAVPDSDAVTAVQSAGAASGG